IEKGYAAHVGPNDGSPEWTERAKGWIRVMYIDALFSMVVYTIVTAAFYLLGAAVIHPTGLVPEGYQMVEVLSRIFTETLGDWARVLFLSAALIVLYATMFTAAAAWARIGGAAYGQIGWVKYEDPPGRGRTIALFSRIFPAS